MEKNWALGESGAKVVEVSYEATHVASAASNLLLEREDVLWITGDVPQHVTLRLCDPHPHLWYVGWHVWHDYLTNPKTVEVASGESVDDMEAQLVCQAMSGAGTQIWKLPNSIPPKHLFLRIKILEAFGVGPTYMNNIVLFANDPGTRFRSTSNMGTASGGHKEGSMGRMSVLLKELDEDIRALHPIKTVNPPKNMLLYVPQEPVTIIPHADAADMQDGSSPPLRAPMQLEGTNGMNKTPQCGGYLRNFSETGPAAPHGLPGSVDTAVVSRGFNDRLCALEQAVASLTQTMNHQREDLTMIKRLLLQQASDRRHELERQLSTAHTSLASQQQNQQKNSENSHRVSRHQVSVDFPEDALRSFVESVLTPKLQRHTKRTEAQTIAKLDEFLKDIVTEITQAVDDRVRSHLLQASVNVGGTCSSLPPYFSESRGMHSAHTPVHHPKNSRQSSSRGYDSNNPARSNSANGTNITTAPVAVGTAANSGPCRTMMPFATTPRGNAHARRSKETGTVPVSIIRDTAM